MIQVSQCMERCSREDAGKVEHLGEQEGHVADDEDDERLHDAHVAREARQEAGAEAAEDADGRTAEHDDDERPHPRHHVHGEDVLLADRVEPLEHVVQHLNMWYNN